MSLIEIPIELTADQRKLLHERTGKNVRAIVITFEEEVEPTSRAWHGAVHDGNPHSGVDVDP